MFRMQTRPECFFDIGSRKNQGVLFLCSLSELKTMSSHRHSENPYTKYTVSFNIKLLLIILPMISVVIDHKKAQNTISSKTSVLYAKNNKSVDIFAQLFIKVARK